ncbi:MAG: hypothetical protein Q4C49_00010 [Bacillota bacterium]|nr:hypothetical protein [Bacillota bacterium]
MKARQFTNALISLVIASLCYFVVIAVLVIAPWYLAITISWWWLFAAIPLSLFAWWITYMLGRAVGNIWY